jgi:hypothetical protein
LSVNQLLLSNYLLTFFDVPICLTILFSTTLDDTCAITACRIFQVLVASTVLIPTFALSSIRLQHYHTSLFRHFSLHNGLFFLHACCCRGRLHRCRPGSHRGRVFPPHGCPSLARGQCRHRVRAVALPGPHRTRQPHIIATRRQGHYTCSVHRGHGQGLQHRR